MLVSPLAPGWAGRVAVLTPLGVYAFVYPFGLGLLLFGWLPPAAAWVGGALLIAQGLAVAAWLALNFGATRGLGAAALVGVGAWALEAVGVSSGVPFGSYSYTPALGAGLGPVPAAIPFAWVAGIGAAFFTARRLVPSAWPAGWVPVAGGAALATLQDAVLETIATRVQGYWRWTAPGAIYYGVPWSNFATWFGAALLLGALLQRVLRPPAGARLRYGWLPPLLYGMSLVMFGLLNAGRGFVIPALLAAALLVLVLRTVRMARMPRIRRTR